VSTFLTEEGRSAPSSIDEIGRRIVSSLAEDGVAVFSLGGVALGAHRDLFSLNMGWWSCTEAASLVYGPLCVVAAQAFIPGPTRASVHVPGPTKGQVHIPGPTAGKGGC